MCRRLTPFLHTLLIPFSTKEMGTGGDGFVNGSMRKLMGVLTGFLCVELDGTRRASGSPFQRSMGTTFF